MAASRPSIDLDEDIAALLERARVSAPVSGKVVPLLLALDVGNVAALLEAVAEDGLEGLGLGKTVQRQLCRCLPALNSCDAAEAALSSFASLSLVLAVPCSTHPPARDPLNLQLNHGEPGAGGSRTGRLLAPRTRPGTATTGQYVTSLAREKTTRKFSPAISRAIKRFIQKVQDYCFKLTYLRVSDMESGGPLLSALQDHQIYPMRTEQQVKMSTEDMRHLLILMGTITVISFVLVVSVVTILLAFVWYVLH